MKNSAHTILLLASLLTLLLISHAYASDLFIPLEPSDSDRPFAEETIRRRIVDIDFKQLQSARDTLTKPNSPSSTTLRLNLFEDKIVTAVIDSTDKAFSGGYSLVGGIADEPLGTVALIVNGKIVFGTVRLPARTYHIESWEDGEYAIREVEEDAPDCSSPELHPDLHEDENQKLERRTLSLRQAPPTATAEQVKAHSTIDIAVFYTSKLRAKLGGTKKVKAKIGLLIAESNRSYKESGVHQSLRLVAAREISYEADDIDVDLDRFQHPRDGHLDGIHTVRNRTQADISVLLHSVGEGRGYVLKNLKKEALPQFGGSMSSLIKYHSKLAFAVASVNTSTFVHELGHLMGLQHDRYEAGCEGAVYPYAYGYVNLEALRPNAPESALWITIMAYGSLCQDNNGAYCSRILRFSNPRQSYPAVGGDPLGVPSSSRETGRAGPADAVKALNNTRVIMELLRDGPRDTSLVAALGNPAPDSPQSGVGLISGWACEAKEVMVEFELADGRIWEFPAAVGTERIDTRPHCGDSDNGFGLLWNWNLLGDGVHTVRVFVDSVLLGERKVTVQTLGLGDFPRGLSGEYTVHNFPSEGKSTNLEWSQERQNFVIASKRTKPKNAGRTVSYKVGTLGNPAPGSAHSGVEVISGWHCTAKAIKIEITNGNTGEVSTTQAGSGTSRVDTKGVCGDSDNGFGLLWNWNLLGDGWHTVKAFADDETEAFAWSKVFVTTLGLDDDFPKGLSGEYELDGFPSAGQSVTVEWRQEQQNFVITGVE